MLSRSKPEIEGQNYDPEISANAIQVLNLRRLAADHAALHSKLPPYYLVQPEDGHFAAADDLSQVTILLTGPPGTPYSEGLWRLQLKIPEDYPNSPPKATFRTRIWHPNVEEMTGAVCVDTLKRDWQSKLTLRDVLIVSEDKTLPALLPGDRANLKSVDNLLSSHQPQPRFGSQLLRRKPAPRRLRCFRAPG